MIVVPVARSRTAIRVAGMGDATGKGTHIGTEDDTKKVRATISRADAHPDLARVHEVSGAADGGTRRNDQDPVGKDGQVTEVEIVRRGGLPVRRATGDRQVPGAAVAAEGEGIEGELLGGHGAVGDLPGGDGPFGEFPCDDRSVFDLAGGDRVLPHLARAHGSRCDVAAIDTLFADHVVGGRRPSGDRRGSQVSRPDQDE